MVFMAYESKCLSGKYKFESVCSVWEMQHLDTNGRGDCTFLSCSQGQFYYTCYVSSQGICLCVFPSQDSQRERNSNFQAFVKLALETLLGSCRRKHEGPRGRQGWGLLLTPASQSTASIRLSLDRAWPKPPSSVPSVPSHTGLRSELRCWFAHWKSGRYPRIPETLWPRPHLLRFDSARVIVHNCAVHKWTELQINMIYTLAIIWNFDSFSPHF